MSLNLPRRNDMSSQDGNTFDQVVINAKGSLFTVTMSRRIVLISGVLMLENSGKVVEVRFFGFWFFSQIVTTMDCIIRNKGT